MTSVFNILRPQPFTTAAAGFFLTSQASEEEAIMSQPFPETREAFLGDPRSLLWKNPGVWPVNKPSGPSSNLVVVRARRALAEKRIGHAGTLDPLASGLLVLLVGNATRLFDELQTMPKTYRAGFELGRRTDSQDITGTDMEGFVPSPCPPIDEARLAEVLCGFMGELEQVPPMHSALKKDGQPLYKLARAGKVVERQPRPVSVYDLGITQFDGVTGVLEMRVSKGFYVRTLIDDMGMALGCGAVMTALERTAIGPFSLEEAVDMDRISEKIPHPEA
ncbi:MAG: tRNA pseudouridine(55) synthase TruB [Planctomycetaceae bacterium]|nr:tRNA pseudouridine(55) synthase TruB [Planctomycetaceae bacterium]